MVRRTTYGYLYALMSALLYAAVSIVAKHLITGGAHPFQVTFYQYVFTFMSLGIWIFFRKRDALRWDVKKIACFALLGIFGGGATNLLFYSALQHLDAGIAAMLFFLHPVFITVFFIVTKIKKIKPVNIICVLIAALGAGIVLDVFSGTLKFSAAGITLGILSGVTYAFYNIFADLKLKEEDPNIVNFFASIAGMLLSAAILAFSGIGFRIDLAALPSIFFLSSFSGVLPTYFFFKALQYIGSEKVSVVASIELPLTLLMAFIILREQMNPVQLLGVILIVSATVWLHRNEAEAGTRGDNKETEISNKLHEKSGTP